MLKKIHSEIIEEIEKLPEIESAAVGEHWDLNDIEQENLDKQNSFLDGGGGRYRATYIFIDIEEIKIKVKLSARKNSQAFTRLKDTITRIANQSIHKYNANHDKLTGIYNRLGLENELKSSKKFKYITYCISDIDNFKQVNDTFSHTHGDLVLKVVANQLKEKCKELENSTEKYIYSRLGGEEFVIAILGDEPNLEVPNQIRKALCGQTEKTNFTSSLGFTYAQIDTKNISEVSTNLYKEADVALYKSKKEGKDRTTNFFEIKKSLGKIIEADNSQRIYAIDIGKNAGVIIGDSFSVYPEKYSGGVKFIIDDGRSKKPIGEYPKISSGKITAKYVQDEISFCTPLEISEVGLEHGSRLYLLTNEESFDQAFSDATDSDKEP